MEWRYFLLVRLAIRRGILYDKAKNCLNVNQCMDTANIQRLDEIRAPLESQYSPEETGESLYLYSICEKVKVELNRGCGAGKQLDNARDFQPKIELA
jgi:hypothetical protein